MRQLLLGWWAAAEYCDSIHTLIYGKLLKLDQCNYRRALYGKIAVCTRSTCRCLLRLRTCWVVIAASQTLPTSHLCHWAVTTNPNQCLSSKWWTKKRESGLKRAKRGTKQGRKPGWRNCRSFKKRTVDIISYRDNCKPFKPKFYIIIIMSSDIVIALLIKRTLHL